MTVRHLLTGSTLGFLAGAAGPQRAIEPARAPVGPASRPAVAGRAVTDSEEIALGAALAAQFNAERGISPMEQDQRFEAYLQKIADTLGGHSRRHLPWRIHYDPNPGFGSGFALPGGHVVIGGGILALMKTEDEAAAVIAHEIMHIDLGQVSDRLATLMAEGHRAVSDVSQWKWQEFGQSYGAAKENLCDYEGARLAVQAGYSPYGIQTLLETFLALSRLHSPKAPPPPPLIVRINQIKNEIRTFHWEKLNKTRPLRLPYGAADVSTRQDVPPRAPPQRG